LKLYYLSGQAIEGPLCRCYVCANLNK